MHAQLPNSRSSMMLSSESEFVYAALVNQSQPRHCLPKYKCIYRWECTFCPSTLQECLFAMDIIIRKLDYTPIHPKFALFLPLPPPSPFLLHLHPLSLPHLLASHMVVLFLSLQPGRVTRGVVSPFPVVLLSSPFHSISLTDWVNLSLEGGARTLWGKIKAKRSWAAAVCGAFLSCSQGFLILSIPAPESDFNF